jgi:O-antigen/teichoic acid export membrane protein
VSEGALETPAPAAEELSGSWRLLVRSFATLTVGEAVARAFGLIGVLLLARRLGPADFGIVSFALALVGWFGLVVDSGTELLSIRDIARNPARFRQIAERVLGLRLAISIGSAGAFAAAVELLARSSRVRDAVVLFAFVLPAVAFNLRWMVLSVRATKAIAIGNIAARVVLTAGIFLLVHDSSDLHRVPFLDVAAESVYGLVILGLVARHFGIIVPRVDLAAWMATLRESLPLLVNALSRAAFYSFDIVAIELFLGPHDVGIYAAGSKPVLFVTGAIGLFSISFLSSFSAAGRADGAWLLRRSLRAVAVVCTPLALLMSASSIVVIPLVFGDAYRAAAGVLAVLAWRIPVAALAGPYGSALISFGRQTRLMRNNIIGATILVAGEVVAIPLTGLLGAAAVSVGATAVVTYLNYRAVAGATWTDSVSNESLPGGSAKEAGSTQTA